MDRRKFLTKVGMLTGAMGLSNAFQFDLLSKLSNTLIPKAEADTLPPTRVLELCFRYGTPMMIFGTGKEFAQLSAPRYSNFSYAGNQITKSPYANSLYISEDAQPLLKHSGNIAITQGVATSGGHTAMFNYREGGSGKGKTSPILELASMNTTSSIVSGIQWPGPISNSARGAKDLTKVTTASFQNLFKKATLKFNDNEMQTILSTATRLSRRQALLMQDQMRDSLGQFANYNKAVQMFSTDYSKLLDISSMDSNFTAGTYLDQRKALGMTMKAFENNLINSSLVVFNVADWHGYQTDKQNASIIQSVSGMIAATIDYLKKTPDTVAGTGKTLWDTTVIVAGSEFTRGISPFHKDNSDGGSQGIMLIGKNIKGGYYGGFTLQDSATAGYGQAHGFDLQTGVTTVGQKNTVEQLYLTTRKIMGLSLTTTEQLEVFQAMFKA